MVTTNCPIFLVECHVNSVFQVSLCKMLSLSYLHYQHKIVLQFQCNQKSVSKFALNTIKCCIENAFLVFFAIQFYDFGIFKRL